MLRSILDIDLRLAPAPTLDARALDDMWRLYAPHHNADEDLFRRRARADLDLFAQFRRRRDGELVGFTGLRLWRGRLSTGTVSAMYVGQSFIAEAYRGHDLIQRTVIAMLLRAWARRPWERIFFWADCLSFRPYLLAARNLECIYPHPQRPTPADISELIDALGERYYGASFDRHHGVVRKAGPLLHEHVATIPGAMLHDPFIAFFAARNPGHARGDGLLAVYPGTPGNLRFFVARRLRQTLGGIARSRRDAPGD